MERDEKMLDTLAMAQQLSGDYRNVFEKADMYNRLNGGTIEDGNERMMELYDA